VTGQDRIEDVLREVAPQVLGAPTDQTPRIMNPGRRSRP
jgi:hypothetical protein